MNGRRPNHRGQYCGRDDTSRQYHLAKLWQHIAASRDLQAAIQPVALGVYRIPPALKLRWATTLADVLPYLDDDEGRVRL